MSDVQPADTFSRAAGRRGSVRNSGKSSSSTSRRAARRPRRGGRAEPSRRRAARAPRRGSPCTARPRPRARRRAASPVVAPLPELGAADLGGRRILHQVVDRRRAVAAEPRVEVLERDADVLPEPASVTVPPSTCRSRSWSAVDRDLGAQAVLLVRPVAEHAVEDLRRERDEVRVGDPRPVEAVARLAPLVLADLAPSPSRSPPGRGGSG